MTAPWWRSAVFYQIYPRSFQDGNGDGVGDLGGAAARLPYLAELGVDAVWLSPFYPSPMRDFGYDVTDYRGVDPLFGTLADFDDFVARAHALGLRVVVDFVPNHTSDEHPWFVRSRARADDEFARWYVWADAARDGGPPNNWRSVTGGSAWSFDRRRGQYFLHSFLPFQPDLNLSHPPVLAALHEAMRFWLDRGVDGLRVDMIDFLAKDPALRDEPDAGYRFADAVHHLNRPELRPILRSLMGVLDEYDGRVLVGEINPELSVARQAAYHGERSAPLMHLPFNFGLMRQPFDVEHLGAYLREYDAAVPQHGWPNVTLGNHDVGRLATRIGPESVALGAMLLLTVRGTPFLYYGDELGLEDVEIPQDRQRDPWASREPGRGRDPNRTPMPWRAGERHAGFSASEPWLPIGERNAAKAVDSDPPGQPRDVLRVYRELLRLRRSSDALRHGDMEIVDLHPALLAYVRRHPPTGESLLVLLNFAPEPVSPTCTRGHGRVAFSTDEIGPADRGGVAVAPFGGAVLSRSDR